MRVPVKAGLVLAAVTSLTACGSVAVPMASRLHVQHSGTQIVVARRGPPAGSRAEAVTLARLMLSRLRLPPGTRRLPLVPVPRPVSGPDLWAGAAAALDPEGYHVLAITVTIAGPRQHTVDKVVTSQAVITRLADALDRSPVQPVQVPNCPDIFAHYRLAFAISRRDPPGVVVLATRWPCGGAQIRAGGRSQPPLEDEGTVVAMADRLLGVTPGPWPARPASWHGDVGCWPLSRLTGQHCPVAPPASASGSAAKKPRALPCERGHGALVTRRQ